MIDKKIEKKIRIEDLEEVKFFLEEMRDEELKVHILAIEQAIKFIRKNVK